MELISNCRLCRNEQIVNFFDLGNQPPANALLKNKNAPEKYYPLSLSWCPECRLVQLNQTIEPKELFENYMWVTGTSTFAKQFSLKFCNAVLEHCGISDKKGYILELASNDGTFLKTFIDRGHNVLGIDPAQNIVEKAVSNGVPTKCGFFSKKLAEEVLSDKGFPKVVIARNILPHVANLHDFVEGIEVCTENDTLVVIEIHYAGAILENLHYDSIYHEHLCYFSLSSVENLLARSNLHVYDIMESYISGGSIILFIKKGKAEKSSTLQRYINNEIKNKTNELSSWREFAEKSFFHKVRLLELLNNEDKEGHNVVGYGASARSSTLLNFCGINSRHLSAIADQNQLKHKFFTAGTHISINSPENVMKTKPDTVFMLAWNFLDEIANILHERFDFKGRLIIPLPGPPKTISIKRQVAATKWSCRSGGLTENSS